MVTLFNSPHNRLGSVMGVPGGTAGGVQFLLGQQSGQFLDPCLPAIPDRAVLGIGKGVRQTAPSHVSGQDALLIRRRPSVLALDPLQDADRRQIVVEFLDLATLPEPNIGSDGEVDGRDVYSGGLRMKVLSTTSSASCGW